MRITLDTNVVLAGLDGTDGGVVARLKRLNDAGAVDLAVASRVIQDKQSDRDQQRMLRDVAALQELPQVPAPFRLDESFLDASDVLCSESEGRVIDDLQRIFGVPQSSMKRMNQLRDVDHLAAHWMARRDVFLTNDRGILDRAEKLEPFGIKVMTPTDFLMGYAG